MLKVDLPAHNLTKSTFMKLAILLSWLGIAIVSSSSYASSTLSNSAAETIANSNSQTDKSWAASISDVWYDSKERLTTIWQQGNNEIVVPLLTHHIRHFYTQEKIDRYQEKPYGLGISKAYINQYGNNESIFALIFQESHFKPEYTIGYQWQKIWTANSLGGVKFGAGYLLGITARPDPGNYFPLPGALPVISISYANFSLNSLYIPGGKGNGNVVFLWAKWMI